MQKNINKIILSTALFISSPFITFAQSNNEISRIIDNIYTSALSIGGVLAFIMIIVGGIYFTVSGSSDKKNEGKDYITSALWGLVLLLGAYLILNTVNPQITALEPPSGESITSTACSQAPQGTPVCGADESPFDDSGDLQCCNEKNSSLDSCDLDKIRECVANTDESLESSGTYSDALDCEGDCSDGIKYQSVDVEAEGGVQYWEFYPQGSGVDNSQCALFAYKKTSSTPWVELSRVGLNECF